MFDLSQKSTQYGILIVLISLVMTAGWWTGRDLQPMIAAISAIVGAFGILSDENKQPVRAMLDDDHCDGCK